MATLTGTLNFPIIIDPRFDLDEVLTFPITSTQDDHHDDRDRNSPTTESTDQRSPNSALVFMTTSTVADVDSCAVCMDRFRSGESGERIPCGHVYHEGCITVWLSVSDSCPLCRCRISCDRKFTHGGKH